MSDPRCPSDDEMLHDLAYVLAVGTSTGPGPGIPTMCPLPVLEQRLWTLATARRRRALAVPAQPVHCALGADPLDYCFSTANNGKASCASVARLWLAYLGHGLEIVTAGSRGRQVGMAALTAFVAMPELVSSITLRVSAGYKTDQRREHLVADLKTLRPLWLLPALDARGQRLPRTRLVVEVRYNNQTERVAMSLITDMLQDIGISGSVRVALLRDPTKLRMQQHPDKSELPALPGYGIDTKGKTFFVDPSGGEPLPLIDSGGSPRMWPRTPTITENPRAEQIVTSAPASAGRDTGAHVRQPVGCRTRAAAVHE